MSSNELSVEKLRQEIHKIYLDAGSNVAVELAKQKPSPLNISYAEGYYDGTKKCMDVFKKGEN